MILQTRFLEEKRRELEARVLRERQQQQQQVDSRIKTNTNPTRKISPGLSPKCEEEERGRVCVLGLYKSTTMDLVLVCLPSLLFAVAISLHLWAVAQIETAIWHSSLVRQKPHACMCSSG
jgi:hypothetical protein